MRTYQPQRERLERWRVAVRQIGPDIGRKGLLDDEIITLLHKLRRPTFFTRDDDFYERSLCHPGYCLVYLAVEKSETAWFVRRFLRQSALRNSGQAHGQGGQGLARGPFLLGTAPDNADAS